MNTEYVIIPICIPNNDTDFLKVSNYPISICHKDDETGRIIDTVATEQEWLKKWAEIYKWTDGKVDFVYGFGTAGGIGDKFSSQKANEKLIEKLKFFTRNDYFNSKF